MLQSEDEKVENKLIVNSKLLLLLVHLYFGRLKHFLLSSK